MLWCECLLVEGLEHLTLSLEHLAVLAYLGLVRRVQKSEELDAGHHAGEFAAVLQSIVAIKHGLSLVSPLERRLLGRIIWVALLSGVEDLVQLDNDLVKQLFLVRVFFILIHEFEKLNDHVTSQKSVHGSWIATECFDVYDQFIERPRAALDQLLTDDGILL